MRSDGMRIFVITVAGLNLALMIFNMIPIGPLDGHYILPYFLPANLARAYNHYNDQYGMYALLGLMALGFAGIPILSNIISFGYRLIDYLIIF